MKKQFSILQLAVYAVALLSFAPMAAAHERDTFKIGDKYYLLTVGSLNEPFLVDKFLELTCAYRNSPGPAAMPPVKGTPDYRTRANAKGGARRRR